MEVTDIDPLWRKASYSGGANGSCVEVGTRGGVMVRDTVQEGTGRVLSISASAWTEFLGKLKLTPDPKPRHGQRPLIPAGLCQVHRGIT